jgi:ankyrin repeat protein
MEIEVLLELIELILTQKDGSGAFTGAISQGKFCFPYFDYLLSEGFLPDGVALLAATQMRQIGLVRFVLKSGVKPTLESFQYAAEHNLLDLCRLFVEFGSREILSTPELETQLKLAINTNSRETVVKLINRGVNTKADNIIQLASSMGNSDIVRLLLEHGADPRTDHNSAIKWASLNNDPKVVRILLEYGADPTAKDNYAIKMASEMGYFDIVRLLLDNKSKYKVDPTAEDNYAIKHASGDDKLAIIVLLKKYGASF